MTWHTVDISPNNGATPIRIADVNVLIARIEGQWFAVEDRCSHADCSFSSDGEVDLPTLICNCHGSEFDVRTGEVLMPPAFDPIRSFPVRETNGRLEVKL